MSRPSIPLFAKTERRRIASGIIGKIQLKEAKDRIRRVKPDSAALSGVEHFEDFTGTELMLALENFHAQSGSEVAKFLKQARHELLLIEGAVPTAVS